MPSPPPTPNMLEEDELENFLVYSPSEEASSGANKKSGFVSSEKIYMNSKKEKRNAQWQQVGRNGRTVQERNNQERHAQEKPNKINGFNNSSTKAQAPAKQGRLEKALPNAPPSVKSDEIQLPPNPTTPATGFKTFYNKDFAKGQMDINDPTEKRGMKSLLEQARVDSVFEKLKIIPQPQAKESRAPHPTEEAHKSQPWYQNPLGGFVDGTGPKSGQAPAPEGLIDTLKAMNINVSEPPKAINQTPTKPNFMGTSKGRFQRASETPELEVRPPWRVLFQFSARRPIEVPQFEHHRTPTGRT